MLIKIPAPFKNRVNLGRIYYWNPWVGCTKISEACEHCYYCPTFNNISVGGFHSELPSDLPLGTVIGTAFKSDFFIEQADAYRIEAWKTIKAHPEYIFLICTKRVSRILKCLPEDWGTGYDNVVLMVTAENQKRADERLPLFAEIPCRHKWIAASPLLEPLNLEQYLTKDIEHVEVCGEYAISLQDRQHVRPLNYDWVVALADQCRKTNIRFSFMAVGSKFIMNNEVITDQGTACYCSKLADSLELDIDIPITFNLNNKEFILK